MSKFLEGLLEGRVAVVTGASGKVGAAIAEELGKQGASIVVHYATRGERARQVVDRIVGLGKRSVAVSADLTRVSEVERIFGVAEELGGCDLLINSAAIFERRLLEKIDDTAWKNMLDTNLSAPFYCCRAGLFSMRKKGGGDIINLVDVGGAIRAWAGFSHYCAAKAGLAMLTRCLALELAPAIRVNGIAPGIVSEAGFQSETEKQRILSRVPLGHEGDLTDVVGAVLYLLQAKYVTGQIIAVDGGRAIA